jgi:NAD kinase
MEPASENKVVLVVRRTRLDELITRFNTEDQAKFYVEHLGSDFSDYKREDVAYKKAVSDAGKIISRQARIQILDRSFIPNFIFGKHDTIVALGQDGLVANVMKYLEGQALIGVNPDPKRWEGVLLPFIVPHLESILAETFAGKRTIREVTMAQAKLNNGQTLRAVNDLFIGPRTHTSARYRIRIGDLEENQSSSGIIVSTGLGSTGWLRSILAGAEGISSAASGKPPRSSDGSFDWSADYLRFSVREPWPSKNSGAGITFGKIVRSKPLALVSQMPENGVIFSDGIENDFLQFNSGTEAVVSLSKSKGLLVT